MKSSLEKLSELMEVAKKGPYPVDDLATIERGINSFGNYVNQASHYPVLMAAIRAKYSDERGSLFDPVGYREAVKEADEKRNITHNKVIGVCGSFNKMCEEFKLEPFFSGDLKNRTEVAEFIGGLIYELYTHEISRERHVIDSIASKEIVAKEHISLDDIIES